MPQIINTNIASLTAQRNLNSSQDANSTALERLSSGLRINSAKDDAAGLAISTRFESQTRGLGVAIRNAGDGISLAQTAEGALGAMTENLQRVRELAVQSSNSTNSPDDRIALQDEVEQRIAELRRTADETNFNGRALLDGSFEGTFQIGANAGETVDVQISELTVDRLGSDAQAGLSSYGTDEALGNGDLIINGVAIGPSQASDDTASVSNAAASAIAKVAAINRSSDETGVTAFANTNEVNGEAMESAAAAQGTIQINGVDIDLSVTANSNDSELASTRSSVVSAINARSDQTGVTAIDSGSSENGVVLVAEDGRNITIDENGSGLTAAQTGLQGVEAGAVNTFEGSYTLVASGATDEIVIEGGDGTGNGDLANAGLERGTYSRATATLTNQAQANSILTGTSGTINGTTGDMLGATNGADLTTLLQDEIAQGGLQDGDMLINGVTIGASSALDDKASDTTALFSDGSASGIAIAAAINRSADSTGVYAEVNETKVVGGAETTAVASAAGVVMDLWINNVDIGEVTSQGDRQQDINTTIDLINSKSGQTGVTAEFNGKSITLTAEDGRNVSVFGLADTTSGTAAFGLDSDVDGIGGVGGDIAFSAAGVGASLGFITALDTTGNTTTAAVGAGTLSLGAVVQMAGANGSQGVINALVAETTHSTVTLESSSEMVIGAGTAGTDGLEDSGFSKGSFGNGQDGQFLSEVDVSTFEGAQAAITAIDNALNTVNSQRAELGAMQNRFESTVGNLEITSENLTAANSRIRDADFAAETAELSRTQVLQQAGISVLAQANQRPQQVLSLLG